MSATLLVIGDFFSTTMQPVRHCVEALVEGGHDARFVASLSRNVANPEDTTWFPDLVIVCQHWPDEFTERDVLSILRTSPLARLTCCYGPWCESDGRTRDIWPLAVRVPVRSAADRIHRELDVIAGFSRPLPLTASRDEIFLFDSAGPITDRFEVH
jgi:hypothetical protein